MSHYFHCVYCHYCCRDYKWPCEGPLFHLRKMPCFLSPVLAGQWTGVDIFESETNLLCPDWSSKFRQDLIPHLNFIFRPGHGILSGYRNYYFPGTMLRHPHHDGIKWVGLVPWILAFYYLSGPIHYPHPVQNLMKGKLL